MSAFPGSDIAAPEVAPRGDALPATDTAAYADSARTALTMAPEGQVAKVDGSGRLIRTLTLTVFLQWMGATAIVPMLPVYIRHLGGSD